MQQASNQVGGKHHLCDLTTAPVHAYIPVTIHVNGHSAHKIDISVPVKHTFALDAGKSRGQVEGLLTKINDGQVYVWAY